MDLQQNSLGVAAFTDPDQILWHEDVQDLNRQRMGRILVNAAHSLWSEQSLFDYKIIIEGEECHVHKFVMAAVSDFFRRMFCSSMKETIEDEVELKGVTKAGFLPILHNIYTNAELKLTKDNVIEILCTASQLQIKFVMEECLRFLNKVVDVSNCVDCLNLTFTFQEYKDPSLKKLAVELIIEHLDHLVEECEIRRLNVDALQHVISQEWIERSEMYLMDLIKDWVFGDRETGETRLKQVSTVVGEIRFGLIRPEHLKRITEDYPFLSQPDCYKHVEEALAYHNLRMHQQVLSQSKLTQVRDEPTVVAFGGLFYTEQKDEESRQSNSMFALGQTWDSVEGFHLPSNNKFRQCGVAVVNNFMVVCGGLKNPPEESSTSRCFIFDPRISRWGRIASLNNARANFALVVHKENLFAFGGEQRSNFVQIVEKYSFARDRWEIVTRTSKGLCAPGACSFDNLIYVIGGKYRDTNGKIKMSKEVQVFDPVTYEWANRPRMRAAQSGHTVLPMISRNTITPRIWTPECCLYVVSRNGVTIDSYFPGCAMWQRVRLHDRPPSSAAVVSVDNVVYYINGHVTDSNGERQYGMCCEYDPTGSTDSYGYPANKGFMPLPHYPEEVDWIMSCVLAPNYYLKKEQLKAASC